LITNLLKNASYNTFAQIVTIILSFLFVPLYISRLTLSGYGIYCFITQFLGWIIILQMGIEPAVIHLTAKYYARKQSDDLNRLISMALIVQFVMSILVAVIIWLGRGAIVSFIIKDKIEFMHEGTAALNWAAANVVVLMLNSVFVGMLKGLQRYDISSMVDIGFNLAVTLFTAFVVWIGFGIASMLWVRCAINLVFFSILLMIIKRNNLFSFDNRLSLALLKEMFDFGSWIVAGRLNRLAINALPQLLIGKFVGPSGIAYFNIATKIVLAINNLLSSAVNVLFPFVSELFSLKDIRSISSNYLKANKYLSLISAPIYCFLAIFSYNILSAWLGNETALNTYMLMILMTIGYYLTSSTMVPTNFALGMGKSKIIAINSLVQILIIIITLPILLRIFGINGSGINLIIFECSSVIIGIIITSNYIHASNFKFWIKDRIVHLIIGTIAFLLPYSLVNHLFPFSSKVYDLLCLAVCFVACTLIYILITVLMGIIDPDVWQQLFNRIRKTNHENIVVR